VASAILSSIAQLAGEKQGLFYHDLQSTGFSPDRILVQALYCFYPRLFRQLQLDFEYFLVLAPRDLASLELLSNYLELPSRDVIAQLLGIELQPVSQSAFPSADILTPLLLASTLCQFSRDQPYLDLLAQLVVQYHMLIQPEYLVTAALSPSSSGYYQAFHLPLSSAQAICLLDQLSIAVYDIHTLGVTLKNRLYTRAQEIRKLL